MTRKHTVSKWRIIARAWPPAGAVFVMLSFVVTVFWLWQAIFGSPGGDFGWLEPLAAFLAGFGAFILAAILIFRKVDDARAESDSYGLARGLATGYYFNFVRPLVMAMSDADHPIHAQVRKLRGSSLEGLVVGLPQTIDDFDPAFHTSELESLCEGGDFELHELKIEIEGRPRPVFTKLALSTITAQAVIVDIPTTLSVVADFANFMAEHELDGAPSSDEAMIEARTVLVAASQTEKFNEVLTEFIDVVNKVGSMETRENSPVTCLHVVPLKRLKRRIAEVADH